MDHRLVELEAIHRDGTADQREQLQRDMQLVETRHLRIFRAGRIGEGHVLRGNGDAREER